MTATAAAVAVITTPVIYNRFSGGRPHDLLTYPEMLARFSDPNILRRIGKAYCKLAASECTKQRLTQLLLTDAQQKTVNSADQDAVSDLLELKTQTDFKNNDILVLEGWVISRTEARQCALFSLT